MKIGIETGRQWQHGQNNIYVSIKSVHQLNQKYIEKWQVFEKAKRNDVKLPVGWLWIQFIFFSYKNGSIDCSSYRLIVFNEGFLCFVLISQFDNFEQRQRERRVIPITPTCRHYREFFQHKLTMWLCGWKVSQSDALWKYIK